MRSGIEHKTRDIRISIRTQDTRVPCVTSPPPPQFNRRPRSQTVRARVSRYERRRANATRHRRHTGTRRGPADTDVYLWPRVRENRSGSGRRRRSDRVSTEIRRPFGVIRPRVKYPESVTFPARFRVKTVGKNNSDCPILLQDSVAWTAC